MIRIDMFMDANQVQSVDLLAKKMGGISRSAFIRLAINEKIRRLQERGY